ncbi:hypothetical protein [Pseudobdellovibrio exovorus]|uniref:Uncharacterized protein n=1 Tax=Pseudobdellovibrio exovorus JSS TaxID=1184267 RepID=M4VFC3_9BACT|nr:hypothetical protein [Pseudobdellovibrio exovorus]AGH96751.1 hypothetical protein A11Q_2535 [Pseudobdellovibrio exovorus JSS]
MRQQLSLKPQDVAVLVKLLALQTDQWKQVDLAKAMGLSQSEVAKSLVRLSKAQLVQNKRVNCSAALEFILHGVKYSFPAEVGALAVGVPTALSSTIHNNMVIHSDEDRYVWPSLHGKIRGQMIKPFYPELPLAALDDSEFYGLMSAIEILRVGRARERKLAERYLESKIKKL